jgi:hypothetical protein
LSSLANPEAIAMMQTGTKHQGDENSKGKNPTRMGGSIETEGSRKKEQQEIE